MYLIETRKFADRVASVYLLDGGKYAGIIEWADGTSDRCDWKSANDATEYAFGKEN